MKTKADVNLVKNFISEKDFSDIEPALQKARKSLLEKTGAGAEFTGWVNWPSSLLDSGEIINRIEKTRERIAAFDPDVIVVIGIGGSYLGARAVYDALTPPIGRCRPEMIFAGHQLDADYHALLLQYLQERNPVVVVISKSGTTTEPAIAFRLIRTLMEDKYGDDANQRIIAITDEKKGALRSLADSQGYESYIIPDDIGGRFSVLTPVGLLPLALCGFSVRELLQGAAECEKELSSFDSIKDNQAMLYAAIRQILYRQGKNVELLSTFCPRLSTLSEWWKQLYGESEGKEQQGIFPASLVFTTDLHSLGQFVQDGNRILFETFLSVGKPEKDIEIPVLNSNSDELLYLEGKKMSYVNRKAEEATRFAHVQGGVPVLALEMPELSEFTLGEIMYFFEFACALSAYTLGVNPFDQPGVEAYKQKMFELLGKNKK
ncbi:MAG: hypothetical protein A2W93_06430 [Bacteroidetes bacterium GWF2_43_63]|nr:MAG: hypothetical protein A2W94_08105 [Bacteroidetes bacterium GWE2_42_42]OFY53257.1 MAG: hypothetical protein A2W93_06430 [Bacteroidetes bacterium GWF2_43_63]HBG71751.1 glucose-6-phosphate isomerase [Bacteroidales bacterium]HCB61584.1 glucose-6-phosphate isomerase [Bacteroidales bacterium]HCY22796.1 glucose-6-phosphate isomerase [Bacteroidales bacterium]